MKYEILENIYRELHKSRAVRSTAEFCRNWLGVERSYMAVLAAKQRDPSFRVLITCAKRLDQFGAELTASQYPAVSAQGERLQRLAKQCVGEVWEGLK